MRHSKSENHSHSAYDVRYKIRGVVTYQIGDKVLRAPVGLKCARRAPAKFDTSPATNFDVQFHYEVASANFPPDLIS